MEFPHVNEAMQYVSTSGRKEFALDGWHIATDLEYNFTNHVIAVEMLERNSIRTGI